MRPKRHHRAFTLLELMIVVAIAGLIFTALAAFSHTGLQTTAVVQRRNLAHQTARTALARFAAEAALATDITAAEEHRFAFVCPDVTGDGAADQVEYAWAANTGTLSRTVNDQTETFAENVTDFALEYQYETDTEVVIAAPGDALPMALASFGGVPLGGDYGEGDVRDEEIDVKYETWYVEQTFENKLEAAKATSVTVRARKHLLSLAVDMYVTLDDLSQTVADGWLRRSQLGWSFQDVNVSLKWKTSGGMILGKTYRLRFRPGGSYPYKDYCGTLQYQKILNGPGLGDGLTLSFWDENGQQQTFGNQASLYFTVYGEVTITTPTRSDVPVTRLKRIRAVIRVTENDQQVEMARTFQVVNQ
jgi:prepilin-type N-terminal cleavage/methylation domain-containing protein